VLAKLPRCRNRIAPRPTDSCHRQSHCAGPLAENLVRMPAYAKDGNVSASSNVRRSSKTRYANLRFSDKANLDEGTVWPVAFALKELTATTTRQRSPRL